MEHWLNLTISQFIDCSEFLKRENLYIEHIIDSIIALSLSIVSKLHCNN
jgi:hypothetical protein